MGDVQVAYPRCNIINWFSLLNGLLTGVGSLLRMFCFFCFMSAVSNKLYYTGDEPYFSTEIMPYSKSSVLLWLLLILISIFRNGTKTRSNGIALITGLEKNEIKLRERR